MYTSTRDQISIVYFFTRISATWICVRCVAGHAIWHELQPSLSVAFTLFLLWQLVYAPVSHWIYHIFNTERFPWELVVHVALLSFLNNMSWCGNKDQKIMKLACYTSAHFNQNEFLPHVSSRTHTHTQNHRITLPGPTWSVGPIICVWLA